MPERGRSTNPARPSPARTANQPHNGDANLVQMDSLGNPFRCLCPTVSSTSTDGYGRKQSPVQWQVIRMHPPRGGTVGRGAVVPGTRLEPRPATVGNLLGAAFNNHIRAGYSWDITTSSTIPRDAADDNYNSFDPYPAVDYTG